MLPSAPTSEEMLIAGTANSKDGSPRSRANGQLTASDSVRKPTASIRLIVKPVSQSVSVISAFCTRRLADHVIDKN